MSKKLPREIRYCDCGCGETFTCKTLSKQKFISYTHYWHRTPQETRSCACGCNKTFVCKTYSKKRFVENHYQKTNAAKDLRHDYTKQLWNDPVWKARLLEKRKAGNSTPEAKKNRQIAGVNAWKYTERRINRDKSHWAHTSKREEVIRKNKAWHKENAKTASNNTREHMRMMTEKSHQNKYINKAEQRLLDLLSVLFPGEYKWVGGFDVMIGGYYPDFINVNGQKKIIELFGDYWHRNLQLRDENRLTQYGNYGYKTLVVWERELKNKNLLCSKLINFNQGG